VVISQHSLTLTLRYYCEVQRKPLIHRTRHYEILHTCFVNKRRLLFQNNSSSLHPYWTTDRPIRQSCSRFKQRRIPPCTDSL